MRATLILLFLSLFVGACSSGLDDVKFSDNPYDNDYDGDRVITITNVDTVHSTTNGIYTAVSYTRNYGKSDGVKLYRNGVKIATNYNSIVNSDSWYFKDITAVSGVTYTYEVRLYFGSGEARSLPYVYTTP